MYPDIFYGIFYHDPDHEWKANLDGEPYSLDEIWDEHKAYAEIANQDMSCFLLVMRDYLQPRFDGTETDSDDFATELLPSYVCIVDRYTDVIA